MSRSRHTPDDYDLERQHELNRRLEIAAEQEPVWAHYRPRHPKPRRPRYFSGVMFRPISPSEAVATPTAMLRP